ncbi:cytochrome c [Mesorhizobium sp. M7A.F.Ca.US.008.03.1.1]|uniref:c-type cytochrome n=1 Tax=Mesorhizobium sp. M7A.F.Ca.US.008.03.1.1 TaxID=2496742 RepID=UPI000FCC9769|nr:cytochrome c [Mesorhizobium sp. M7A.F.Ca.US.008.03.1.1]RUW60689.1 cytochrome c [Mesorhizobium sp. M7A.F.Ca.US.008.03.1.1]
MKRTSIYAIPLLLIGIAAAVAATHLPDKPVIVARQSSMKEMAAAARQIAGMFGGKIAYDAPAFRQAAETIHRRTGVLAAEFPADSLGSPSAAKQEIDQSRDEFDALASHIATLASALAVEADKAPADSISSAMRMGPDMAMGGSLLGKRAGAAKEADPSKLPAEHLLHLILQDCTSCHAKFRAKVQ